MTGKPALLFKVAKISLTWPKVLERCPGKDVALIYRFSIHLALQFYNKEQVVIKHEVIEEFLL